MRPLASARYPRRTQLIHTSLHLVPSAVSERALRNQLHAIMRIVDRVETEGLVLRRWTPEDLDPLIRVFEKPEVWWFPFQRGLTAEETERFLQRKLDEWESRGWAQWAAVSKHDAALIGFIGLSPPDFLPEVMPAVEVGFRLDPHYWDQGLATEGGRAAHEFGFGVLGLDEIVSIYEPRNVASGRVMVSTRDAASNSTGTRPPAPASCFRNDSNPRRMNSAVELPPSWMRTSPSWLL